MYDGQYLQCRKKLKYLFTLDNANFVEYCKLQNNPLEIQETDDATYIKSYLSKKVIDSFEDVEESAEQGVV